MVCVLRWCCLGAVGKCVNVADCCLLCAECCLLCSWFAVLLVCLIVCVCWLRVWLLVCECLFARSCVFAYVGGCLPACMVAVVFV